MDDKNLFATWSKNMNPELALQIEQALTAVKAKKGFFGGWAISEHALRYFTQLVFKDAESPILCEFGSGQSTRYWNELLERVPFEVHSFEHHPSWIKYNHQYNHRVHMHETCLLQISDSEKNALFSNAPGANPRYIRSELPESEWQNTRVKNCFYDMEYVTQLFRQKNINAILLDGPNGNGRSIIFPFILPFLKEGTLIMLDDFEDYPFIEELSKIADFEVLISHRRSSPRDNWCILRFIAQKTPAPQLL